MHAFNSALGPIDMQATIPQIDLSPSQGAEFSGSQSMSISKEDPDVQISRLAHMPVVHVAHLLRLANRGEPGDAPVR